MWLYFNSNGQLTTILEHGSPARAGSTQFKIFAVFEGIDNIDKLREYSATIKLKKPDLTGSEYPTLLMELATAEFEKLPNETNTGDFENLMTYYGFLFDFGSFNDNQEEEVLLDTQGLWEAVITLIKDDLFVQGVATFNVGGIGTEQEISDTVVYEIVTNQIVHDLNQRALKTQTILVINNWDELNLNEYEEGQNLLRNSDSTLFKVIVENETKVLEEAARFVTIVDNELSNTSENPVQNKIVTQHLEATRKIAEGASRTFVISVYDTLTTLKNSNCPIYLLDGTNVRQDILNGLYDPEHDVSFANNQFDSNDEYITLDGSPYTYVIARYVENNPINPVSVDAYYLIKTQFEDGDTEFKIGDEIIIVETRKIDRWFGDRCRFYQLETSNHLYKHMIVPTTGDLILAVVNSSGYEIQDIQDTQDLFDERGLVNCRIIEMQGSLNSSIIGFSIIYSSPERMEIYYIDMSGTRQIFTIVEGYFTDYVNLLQ